VPREVTGVFALMRERLIRVKASNEYNRGSRFD